MAGKSLFTYDKDSKPAIAYQNFFEEVLKSEKPVLVDSARVIKRSDIAGLTDAQGLLRSIPLGSTDPAALLQAAGYQVGERIAAAEFTLAEIPLPLGGSIPLTIRLRDIVGAGR